MPLPTSVMEDITQVSIFGEDMSTSQTPVPPPTAPTAKGEGSAPLHSSASEPSGLFSLDSSTPEQLTRANSESPRPATTNGAQATAAVRKPKATEAPRAELLGALLDLPLDDGKPKAVTPKGIFD